MNTVAPVQWQAEVCGEKQKSIKSMKSPGVWINKDLSHLGSKISRIRNLSSGGLLAGSLYHKLEKRRLNPGVKKALKGIQTEPQLLSFSISLVLSRKLGMSNGVQFQLSCSVVSNCD